MRHKKAGCYKTGKTINEISYEMTDFAMKFLRKKYFFDHLRKRA